MLEKTSGGRVDAMNLQRDAEINRKAVSDISKSRGIEYPFIMQTHSEKEEVERERTEMFETDFH
jgi:hypothetical protein